MIQKWVLVIVACIAMTGTPTNGHAQNGFDILYDFCTDTLIASDISSCLAEDDRYFVAGGTMTPGVSTLHGYLASFNYSGQILWDKKLFFPGPYNGYANTDQLVRINTDKYLLTGSIRDGNIHPQVVMFYPYMYLFNSKGDSICFKKYVDSFQTSDFSSAIYDGSNIVTVGMKSSKELHPVGSSYNFDSTSVWLCKWDTLGNMVWERELLKFKTVDKYQNAYKIVLSSDGKHYIIGAALTNPLNGKYGSTIVKTDSSGNLIWVTPLNKTYLSREKISLVANANGGYYFVTSVSSTPNVTTSEVFFGKIDEQGTIKWSRTFSDSLMFAEGYSIKWAAGQRHLLMLASGYAGSRTGLIKADTNGNILWYRMPVRVNHFHPEQSMTCLDVTKDDHYLMGGYISANVKFPGIYDTLGKISWMILTDSSGCRYYNDPACWPVSVKEKESINKEIKVYPNPVWDELTVANAEGAELQVYNSLGKMVYSARVEERIICIQTSNWPIGMYVLRLRDNAGNVIAQKILKE